MGRLSGLSDADLEHLRGLGARRIVERDNHLCFEGGISTEAFLIESGSVRVVMSPPSGRELILATRSAGQLVGEFAAFDGRPRSASLLANEPTTVVVIPQGAFRRAVAERATLSAYFLEELTVRLREADSRTMATVGDDVPTRLASRLVALADAAIEHGQASVSDVVSLGVRQAELAGWVGSSREAVARVLGEFRRCGVVRTGRGVIDILDLPTLRAQAGVAS